jgi:hypothetical protein
MAGSLREALSSAVEEAEVPEQAVETAPSSQEAAPSEGSSNLAERSAVDDDSSDLKEPPTVPVEPTDKPDAITNKTAEGNQTTPSKLSRVDRPPVGWKGQAKGEWATVPLAIRQEVTRREAEVEKVLREAAPLRQFQQQFQQTVAPYMARIDSYGTPPVQAIGNLLKADYLLSSAPKQQRAQLMAQFIKDYEVDIVELDNALSGAAQPNPQGQQTDIEQRILQQVQQMVAPFYQQQNRQQQQQQQRASSTVESMSQDHIKYPYFNEVRQDMADIVEMMAKRGVDVTLEDAYSRATRFNPDVSSQLERQTTMSSANQQHQQAQRSRLASSSVSGAPASGGSNGFVGNGDLRSSLEAAFNSNRL